MEFKIESVIKSKYSVIGIWICLVAIFVIAVAPTSPTVYTDNQTRFFNSPVLVCSGASDSDGDTVYYEFWQVYGILFSDNFNRANSATVGNGWVESTTGAGTASSSIVNNQLELSTTGVDGTHALVTRAVVNEIKRIDWKANISNSGSGRNSLMDLYAPNGTACIMAGINGGNLYANATNYGTANVGFVYNFSVRNINQSNKKYDFYINDTLVAPNSNFVSGCTQFSSLDFDARSDGTLTISNIEDLVIYRPERLLQNTTGTTFTWTNASNGFSNDWMCRAGAGGQNSAFVGNFTVYYMNYTNCDTGNLALNISFRNETNNAIINGTLSSLDTTFDSGDSGGYSNVYSDSGNKVNYGFCLNPNGIGVNATRDYRFLFTSFPQRQLYQDTTSLAGGSQSNQILYLLDSSSGSYVTFQVVDTGGSVISGAYVQVTKNIGGSDVIIVSGNTDASGTITFWLDPLSSVTLYVSEATHGSTTQSITPTSSSYTLTLGTATSTNYTSPYWGVSYDIGPKDIILNNNTVYNFTFNISSTYWDLTSYGFTLINSSNGAVLNSTSGSSSTGSVLSVTLNTDSLNSIVMDYYWNIDGNFTNQSQTWVVKSTYQGNFTIMTFFDDLKNYVNNGGIAGLDAFGLAMISIVLIITVTGILAYEFGIYNPTSIGFVVVVLVWALEFLGMIPTLVRPYALSLLVTIVWLGFLVQENSR